MMRRFFFFRTPPPPFHGQMAATDLGYVGFAADIYGVEYPAPVEDMTQRSELANFYRGNATLFTGRIQAAVNLVKDMSMVDESRIAVAGYCFGGTGVLQYALLAINDVNALISFHGGLTSLPEPGATTNVTPKVLVLSGGDDDTSTEIIDLENTMNDAEADWEITRYSQILHGFTNFHDDRYNAWADMRSWTSMHHLLRESFGEIEFVADGPLVDEDDSLTAVPYVDDYDGTALTGYLALPDSDLWETPVPGVVVLP